MVGGVKFEHTHRMVAEFIGLLTIIVAIWTWRAERRSWVRKLGIAAIVAVIAQGVLGGITVLFYLPPAVSTAHAALGQTFFCILVALAVVTRRDWLESEEASTSTPVVELQHRRPSLHTLTLCAVTAVYVQLILGAGFRHSGIKLLPHLLSAVVVTVLLLWTPVRALSNYSHIKSVRRAATALLTLLIVQLSLGFAAYLTRVQWGKDAVQPQISMVVATVAHVAVGALVLATSVILAMQTWRNIPPIQQSVLLTDNAARKEIRKAVTA